MPGRKCRTPKHQQMAAFKMNRGELFADGRQVESSQGIYQQRAAELDMTAKAIYLAVKRYLQEIVEEVCNFSFLCLIFYRLF